MTVLTLSDGTQIDLRISGEGTPVVFIHGWAMHGGLFELQRHVFSRSQTVITFDLRGHGQTASSVGPAPTIERLGADLVEIFEQLELENAVCVGWSMGAMVAWEALTHETFAKHIGGLVVIDMSPRLTNDSSWRLGLADGRGAQSTIRAAEAMRRDWQTMVKEFVPRIFASGSAARHGAIMAEMLKDAATLSGETMAGLWESMAVQDYRRMIGRVKTPTLVMHGEKSQLYSKATSAFIACAAQNAELASFHDSGHAPHLEEPTKFNDRLKKFISSIERKPIENAPYIAAVQ